MNREALFCDGTGDYVCPAEPEINEKVVLRFRTAHNDVDEVKLHIGEQEYPMWKTRTDGEFDFYEIEYQLGEDILRYCFEIKQGAEILFLTNASGGIHRGFEAGDFMMITDQIASFVPSPLIGPNIEEFGERFPDMSHIYDEELQEVIRKSADYLQIDLKEGTYIQLPGPNFESPAEIRMCKAIGADAVGMSTACEAIAANHMGMKICGISCIANPAAGISKKPLTHEEVQQSADRAAPKFQKLVTECICRMGKSLKK